MNEMRNAGIYPALNQLLRILATASRLSSGHFANISLF